MARFRKCLSLLLLACCGCKAGGSSRSDVASTYPPSARADASVAQTPSSGNSPSHTETEIQQVSAEIANPEELPSPHPEHGGVTEPLPLFDAISLALTQNPDLVALRQTERVGVAAYGVASTYPFNPFVQAQATPYQDLPGEGPGTTAHYVLVMQRIQLAHQQQYREDAARSSLSGIRWNILQAELQTVSLTAQLYFTLLYQRGLLEVAQASQENNQQLLDVLTKRFEGGDASAADVATVRVDARSTQQQLRLAEANYQSARRDLLRQLGMPSDSPSDFAGDLRTLHWRLPTEDFCKPSRDDLAFKSKRSTTQGETWITSWAASRPDVLSARANISVARANLRLASANRVPDVQLGPYYQRNPDGMTHLGFRTEMNLPIIDTGRPLETQRGAELGQQTTIWRQTLLRAELEAQAAFERYELAYRALAVEFADDSAELPQELQSLERQFREGEVDVVRVIQARTSILQNQRARLDLLNELAQSAALLVGATGMSLESLVSF